MTSERPITEDCIAVAFYGIAADPDTLRSFYMDIIEWFELVGCPPDKIAIEAQGFSGNIVSFKRTHARLVKKRVDNFTNIDVFSMLPNGTLPVVHWWTYASVILNDPPSFVLTARASVSTLEDAPLGRLVERCIVCLNPAYGIGYHRDHGKGPGLYAIGINYSSSIAAAVKKSSDEKQPITQWGQIGLAEEVFRNGLLRDIYPHNYLAQPHLMKSIEGQTLQDWITVDPNRGTLTNIADRMTLWKVPSAQLEMIRRALQSSKIIYDWNDYIT